jgi:hypothetical protein
VVGDLNATLSNDPSATSSEVDTGDGRKLLCLVIAQIVAPFSHLCQSLNAGEFTDLGMVQ